MYENSMVSSALLCALIGLAPPCLAETVYTVTDLGALERGGYSTANGLNAHGQAVGISSLTVGDLVAGERQYHAFSSQNGSMMDLGTFGGSRSEAYAVNTADQIVGSAFLAEDQAYHAFITQNGQLVDLGTLGGSNSEATAINNLGQIVGDAFLAGDHDYHAFISENGLMTDLGTLGGSLSEATAINDSGQVVGNSWTVGDETQHAFISQNGAMIDLTPGYSWSAAYGINAHGQVVGQAPTSDGRQHAFVTQMDGRITDLGTLGGDLSEAKGINGYGQVVGGASIAGEGLQHAFVTQHGAMTDLNSLIDGNAGWTLVEANGINDDGMIIGAGYTPGGAYHAYALTPVYTEPLAVRTQPSAFNTTVTGSRIVSITASAAIVGGQPPLQVQWSVRSGGFSLSSTSDTSTNISAWVPAGQSVHGQIGILVTDARGRTAQASIPVTMKALFPKQNPHVYNPGDGEPIDPDTP